MRFMRLRPRLLSSGLVVALMPLAIAAPDSVLQLGSINSLRANFRHPSAKISSMMPANLSRRVSIGSTASAVSALHWAAGDGDLQEVTRLLAAGTAVDEPHGIDGSTALHWAARSGSGSVVNALLSAGANIEALTNGQITPLWFALVWPQSDTNAVQALLYNGANVEFRPDDHSPTPIGLAAVMIHDDAWKYITLLRSFGANVDAIQDQENQQTALHQAMIALPDDRAMWVVASLVASNDNSEPANTEAQDILGHTALHYAAFHNKQLSVQALLDSGAMPNPVSSIGATPLHIAAGFGSVRTVLILLASGADVNSRDEDGDTPLTWANALGQSDIEAVLRSAGGIW